MKAEIVARYFRQIIEQHASIQSQEKLLLISNELTRIDNTSSKPSWLSLQDEFSLLISNLDDISFEFELDNSVKEYFDGYHLSIYLGHKLGLRLGNCIVDNSNNFALFKDQITNLREKHDLSINRIKNFDFAMKTLGIETYKAPNPALFTLIIDLPSNSLQDISRFSKNLVEIETLINSLHRALNLDVAPIVIEAVSASRVKLFFGLSSLVAASMSATISFGLDSYKSFLDIQKNQGELARLNMTNEFEMNIEEIKNKISQACATKIKDEMAVLSIEVNDLEIKAACRQALSMISNGFEFKISDLDTKASENDDQIEIIKIHDFTMKNARKIIEINSQIKALSDIKYLTGTK